MRNKDLVKAWKVCTWKEKYNILENVVRDVIYAVEMGIRQGVKSLNRRPPGPLYTAGAWLKLYFGPYTAQETVLYHTQFKVPYRNYSLRFDTGTNFVYNYTFPPS